MTFTLWMAFFSYAAITAITPGPNNILAMSATCNHGMRRSKGLLAGIYAGFFCVMAMCGLLGAAITALLPDLLVYMKYIGAAYILWLAWHIAMSRPVEASAEDGQASFFKGFLLQFVNIKIIIYGLTIFTGFVFPNTQSLMMVVMFVLLASLIGNGATHLWAVGGAVFTDFFRKNWRIANAVMALSLVYSAVELITTRTQ